MPKKYRKGSQYRKSYRRGGAQYRAPTRRSSAHGAGCIKIVKGRNKIRIWNNCGRDIIIGPGGSLALDIVNTVRYDLDYGTAVAVFAEPVEGRKYSTADEEPSLDDYDWV